MGQEGAGLVLALVERLEWLDDVTTIGEAVLPKGDAAGRQRSGPRECEPSSRN
jgi:hypothetical protein